MKLLLFIILLFILFCNIYKPVREGLITPENVANGPLSRLDPSVGNYVSEQDKLAFESEKLYAQSYGIAKFGTDLCKIKIKEDDYKDFKMPAWCYPRRDKGQSDTCSEWWKFVDDEAIQASTGVSIPNEE